MTHSIDINEMIKLLESNNPPILLDVRRKADCESTPQKIVGATWRDPEKIDTWVRDLPPGRSFVVYCVKGGAVSQSVVDRIRKEGLDAEFLEGGLKAWSQSGQPVEAVC